MLKESLRKHIPSALETDVTNRRCLQQTRIKQEMQQYKSNGKVLQAQMHAHMKDIIL
jgi:hypothetical protein